MKKFIKNIIICSIPIICINLAAILLLVLLSANDDLTHVNYASALDKGERLDSLVDRKKIIIIGGSNARFSYNSAILKKELGIEPVNMGIHIGLGLDYMLEEVEGKVSKGDILLISAEYQHYMDEKTFYGNEARTDMYLIRREWYKAVFHMFNTHNFLSLYQLTRRRIKRLYHKDEPLHPEMETRDKYNFYGDYTGHYNLSNRNWKNNHSLNSMPDPEIMNNIGKRVKSMERKGVCVLITPPPLYNRYFQKYRKSIDHLTQAMEKRNLHFITDPENVTYPRNLFYDSEYHLNHKGGLVHTYRIAGYIKKHIE